MGQGTYGVVVTDAASEGVVHKRCSSTPVINVAANLREVAVMSAVRRHAFRHPHLCTYTSVDFLTITMPHLGDPVRPDSMTEDERLSASLQLVSALAFLHCALGVAHRDLTLRNMVWDAGKGHLTLIDFGMARPFPWMASSGSSEFNTEVICGMDTRAPEVLMGSPTRNDYLCDVFSLGAALLDMWSTSVNFKNFRTHTVYATWEAALGRSAWGEAQPGWFVIGREALDLVPQDCFIRCRTLGDRARACVDYIQGTLLDDDQGLWALHPGRQCASPAFLEGIAFSTE